jgi:hypothetical protein
MDTRVENSTHPITHLHRCKRFVVKHRCTVSHEARVYELTVGLPRVQVSLHYPISNIVRAQVRLVLGLLVMWKMPTRKTECAVVAFERRV